MSTNAKGKDRGYIACLAVAGVCTMVSVPLRSQLAVSSFAMIYLLGIIAIAMRYNRRTAIASSFLNVTAFHYFCVPVFDSFVLIDSSYVITLAAMLLVALLISSLTSTVRSQAAQARDSQIAIETERMRNSFLSAVSHDLKTPLASIYGAATGLLEQHERLGPEDRRELVETIADESERLNRVVSNLLDMSRIDAGLQLRKDWYSIEEIVGSAIASLDRHLRDRSLHTRIAPDLPLVYVDALLLEQVFSNLVENANKYTPAASPIEIEAHRANDAVIISIADRGPGFTPGEEQQAFQKFFRGRNQNQRGVGLGLTICRAIAEVHGGTVTAENRADGGAMIIMRLPIGENPPAARLEPEGGLDE